MRRTLACAAALLSSTAFAGNENGNGTDPLRDLFEDGRRQAAARVLDMQPCSFRADVRSEVREWVVAHKAELAADILETPYDWITDPQATCAFTRPLPRSEVTLSFQACGERVKDISDAGRVALHESVHHLGFTDEAFPDEVAAAVYRAQPEPSCPLPPSEDPFDPASCPGSPLTQKELKELIPLPESPSRELGRFAVSIRARTCYGPQFCSSWRPSVDSMAFYIRSGSHYQPALSGKVMARLRQNEAYLLFESNQWQHMTYFIDSQVSGTALRSREIWSRSSGGTTTGQSLRSGHEGTPLSFEGKLARSCARLVGQGFLKTRDANSNDITQEYEVVLLSRFK